MAGSVQTEIDDIAAELKVVLEPLASLGFPVADWTYSAFTNLNWRSSTIKNFIENMKMFNRIEDERVRDDCLALGIKKFIWTKITSCTFSEMYNFTRFIQSDDGKTLVLGFAKKRSTQTDKAYLSLINLQLSGLALAKKCKRAELEEEIAELRRRLAQQQMELEKKQLELEKKVADVDGLFFPCAQYQPLDEVTLLKRCYEKNLTEATKQCTEVLELEQDLLETLKVKYGVVVRQEHSYEFMRDEDRRKAIKVWANEKIVELGERKEASILHHLLADT